MIMIFSINNSNVYITMSTFTTNNISIVVSNASFSTYLLNNSFSTFFSNNDFSTFTSFIFDVATSTFVNELIFDSILQKTRLFNIVNNETNQLQHAFNRHSKLRFVKNSFVNFFIDFVVFLNCDFVVIKIVLTFLIKVFFVDFYESKTYKKTMTNAQHKINWQFDMNDEMISHKNNKIWILMNETFKNRKIFIDKWVYKCKKNIHEKIIRYKIRWCVKNFKQLKIFDYYEIFVSMIKSMNYKIIFVIVAINDWNIKQMNVKIVFYNIMNEKIYLNFFHDYRDLNRFKKFVIFLKFCMILNKYLKFNQIYRKNF